MKNTIFLLLFIGHFACFPIYGAVYKTVQSDQLFSNTACTLTDSCDLKSFRLYVEDATITSLSFGTNYATSAFMSYQTAAPEQLENYAVVQFIRGCQFDSEDSGKISLSYSREFFGQMVNYKHPTWVIDSVDLDPMYNSDVRPNTNRHGLYRWNTIPGSFAKESEKFYLEQTPALPLLYVKYRPGSAFYDHGFKEAKNLSLQFKICIFKTTDIPLVSTPEGLTWDKAIHCFDWYSSFIYNHQLQKFESPKTVSPICLE